MLWFGAKRLYSSHSLHVEMGLIWEPGPCLMAWVGLKGATGQAAGFVYDFNTMASTMVPLIAIVVYGFSCSIIRSLYASIIEIENSIVPTVGMS